MRDDVDIYGDIVDAGTVEGWVRDTLQAWIVAHLAHQERRKGLPPRTIPEPESWPTVSDFDIELETQMPAITLISPGTSRIERDRRGEVRKTWRVEVAVALAGSDETEARDIASLYLAAIEGALEQGDPTLGGHATSCVLVGPDDHAYGVTEAGAQRAIYGTAFEVTVRYAIDRSKGPDQPPEDPYEVPEAAPSLIESELTVTATPLEDTP